MTQLYLYAICEAGRECELDVRGVGGAAVAVQPVADVAVACSRVDAGPQPSERALWEHEAVVEQLMESGPVLPVRFGTVVPEQELSSLAARGEEFTRALDRVRGKVEYALRIRPSEGRAPDGSLPALAAVHEPLARLAVDSTVNVRRRPATTLEAAYLVEREQADRFEAEVARLTRGPDAVAAVCTGPWPPYTFVSAAA